jgi:hypothetical protein
VVYADSRIWGGADTPSIVAESHHLVCCNISHLYVLRPYVVDILLFCDSSIYLLYIHTYLLLCIVVDIYPNVLGYS